MKKHIGKIITVKGAVEPDAFGKVMMHEHIFCDAYNAATQTLITEEKPISDEHRKVIMEEGVPFLKKCNDYGCFGILDPSPPPWRAFPTFYIDVSNASNMHIVLSTGIYGVMHDNEYWVKCEDDKVWPWARDASREELIEYWTREIVEGIQGTNICAGAIKLGTRAPENKPLEDKFFKAAASVQMATGVHITTHCTELGSESSQLRVLEEEGMDLSRTTIGHTARHLMDKERRKICMDWMRKGANFLPTNLIAEENIESWQPLVDAIHEVFDAGLGAHIVMGLDCVFGTVGAEFCYYVMPPPPYVYMFEKTLPAFRKLGLTEEEEDMIMRVNPQRILQVQ